MINKAYPTMVADNGLPIMSTLWVVSVAGPDQETQVIVLGEGSTESDALVVMGTVFDDTVKHSLTRTMALIRVDETMIGKSPNIIKIKVVENGKHIDKD